MVCDFHSFVSGVGRTVLASEAMTCSRNAGTTQPPRSETLRKSQSLQDQQFEERRRIAERLAQALREAGYSCDLGENSDARTLKRDD